MYEKIACVGCPLFTNCEDNRDSFPIWCCKKEDYLARLRSQQIIINPKVYKIIEDLKNKTKE